MDISKFFSFQGLVHELTERCWDKCMDKPSTKLDSKTQHCMSSCVDRFIDSTNFIANRLQTVSSSIKDE